MFELVLVDIGVPYWLHIGEGAGDGLEDRGHLLELLHIVRRSYVTVVGEPAEKPLSPVVFLYFMNIRHYFF